MLTSAIYCRIVGLTEDVSFEAHEFAKRIAAGASQLPPVLADTQGWDARLFAWQTPTYMTFGQAEWVPAMPTVTRDFRKAVGIFTRDGYSPLIGTISPLLVMTRALTDSIPRHLEQLTDRTVSIRTITLRLERLLRNSPGDLLRYEWTPREGAVLAMSATSNHILASPPQDFIDEYTDRFTAYNMIWRGFNITLRRDFSLEIANIGASFEQIALGMADLIATLREFQIFDMRIAT